MKASIHQPAYVPWLGYFDKIAKSDVHIFFDDAEYSKNNLFNRNKIKTPQGEAWLTIPVRYKSDAPISEIKIDNGTDWGKKHWNTIKMNYSKTPYFKDYCDAFEKIYQKDWENLADITISMNKTICDLLGIKTKMILSSELKAEGLKNEKLVDLCKKAGADIYLSGQGAKVYMDEELFKKNNIKVEYQEFSYPRHEQLWGEFIPNLSILDFLFNCGTERFKNI